MLNQERLSLEPILLKTETSGLADEEDCGRSVSLEELRSAHTSKQAWVSVDGVVHDLTKFRAQHPGGSDFISMSAGKDVSKLFDTYHGLRQRRILRKYGIGKLIGQDLPTFPPADDFWITLRQRVDEHFELAKIDRKHSPNTLRRYALTVVVICCLYWMQWTLMSPSWTFYSISVAYGVALAQYCVSAIHDGSHGAIGRDPRLWKLLLIGHDCFNGCSSTLWIYQHVMSHHIFPNIDGFDTDIETAKIGFRRIKSTQKYFDFYRLQALYAPILYVLLACSVRMDDFIFYFTKCRGPLTVNPFTLSQDVVFWGGKLFFVLTRIILPLSLWGASMTRVIAAFFLTDFTFSIVLATIFQATHVVDSAAFPRINPKTGNIDTDWARIQVETAQDYAHDQPLTTLFSGSLNYQVVHHLFPTVAQEHIPALGPIVRQTAKEFGVKYEVKNSLWSAVGGHIGLLRMLGTPPSSH